MPAEFLSAEQIQLARRLLAERGIAAGAGDNPFRRRDRSQPLPLHPNQEGLWALDLVEPGNFNVPGSVRLLGPLSHPALEQALSQVISRHEALRTTFPLGPEGRPHQQVHEPAAVTLPVADLSHLGRDAREAEARKLAAAEARRPFDLCHGPLVAASLLRLGPAEHVFLLNLHHAVADGIAMGIITRELVAFYRSRVEGGDPGLGPPPAQFPDYAAWVTERLARGELDDSLGFWRRKLAGANPELRFPEPGQDPSSYRGAHQPLVFPAEVSRRLREMVRREHLTLHAALLAGFAALLHAATGQTDLVIGSTFANRPRRELEDVVGFFANTLPLALYLGGDPTFSELARRTFELCLEAQSHQEVPLPVLRRALGTGRSESGSPPFQAVFDLLTPDLNPAVWGYGLASPVDETHTVAGLRIVPQPSEYPVARFDLAVFLWDSPSGIAGSIEYRSRFGAGRIAELGSDLIALVDRISADPGLRLKSLAAMTAERRRQPPAAGHEQALSRSLRGHRRRTLGSEP